MRELLIDIDWPSCKALGVLSDDFKTALEHEFDGSEYKLRIVFSASPVNTLFDSGYSRTGLSDVRDDELDHIRDRISVVFKNCVEQSRSKT